MLARSAALADRIVLPAEISVSTTGRALVRVTVEDDDGNGLAHAPVDFRLDDPDSAVLEFSRAYTDLGGRAYTVVITEPHDFQNGEFRVERTKLRASVGELESDPSPIIAESLVIDGITGFEGLRLEPFTETEQTLIGYTFGGFLPPRDLVGMSATAKSVDPRVAEIGPGLFTGVDEATGRAIVEFPVRALREGTAQFIIDFVDLPIYTSEVVIEGAGTEFLRGDCNDDESVDISDAVCVLDALFSGGALPGCLAVANINGDTGVDISDPTFLLNYLFLGGPSPSAPFPDCGESDLAGDEELGCEDPPCS